MTGHLIKIGAAATILALSSLAWGADAKINGCSRAQISLAAEDLCRYLELNSTNPTETIEMLEYLKKHARKTVSIETEGVKYTFHILTYRQLSHYSAGSLVELARLFQTLGPVTKNVSLVNGLMMRVEAVSKRRFGREFTADFPWIEHPLFAGKFLGALAGGMAGFMSGMTTTMSLTMDSGFWIGFPASVVSGIVGGILGGAASFYAIHYSTAVVYGIANRFLGAVHHATKRFMRPSAQFIESGIKQLAANPAKKYTALVVVKTEDLADDIAVELEKKHSPGPRLLPSP